MDRVKLGGLWDLGLWLLGLYKRYKVFGKSMSPTLLPEDEVLITKKAGYVVGNIVVAKHPQQSTDVIIKRIVRLDEGLYYLVGDNESASTDSRHWGIVSHDQIIGKVVCKLF